jgi:hypothetical protein
LDKKEHNKYAMLRAIASVFAKHLSTAETIPALVEAINKLNRGISLVEKKDDEYLNITKGLTLHKRKTAKELTELSVTICGALYVYGQKVENAQILGIADVNDSSLKRMRESELLQKCKNISEHVQSNQQHLVPYGITAEQVTEYVSKVKIYDEALSKKNSKHNEKVASRNALRKAFTSVDELLKKELDKLMEQMKKRDIDFYNHYQQSRSVKELGIRHRKTDEDAKAKVKAEAEAKAKADAKVNAKTDAKAKTKTDAEAKITADTENETVIS